MNEKKCMCGLAVIKDFTFVDKGYDIPTRLVVLFSTNINHSSNLDDKSSQHVFYLSFAQLT